MKRIYRYCWLIVVLIGLSFTSSKKDDSVELNFFLSDFNKKYSVPRNNRNIFEYATWEYHVKDKFYSLDSIETLINKINTMEYEKIDTSKVFVVYGCLEFFNENKRQLIFLLKQGQIVYNDKRIKADLTIYAFLRKYIPVHMIPEEYSYGSDNK